MGDSSGLVVARPPTIYPGGRHSWTMLQGCMSPDVLEWLQEDCRDVEAWKAAAHDQQVGIKSVVSGRMVADPGTKALNALPIEKWLPSERLLSWLRAFKAKNASSLAKLCAEGASALRALGQDSLGVNGKHFLDTPVDKWFATCGQIHIFQDPADLEERRHFDGGASVLHIGVTLFGRRELRWFEGVKNSDTDGKQIEVMRLVPGSVYFGVVTGCRHSVAHQPPRLAQETFKGHSITCMIRCSLFPDFASRRMIRVPLPKEMFEALALSFVASLRKEPWALPSLAECSVL